MSIGHVEVLRSRKQAGTHARIHTRFLMCSLSDTVILMHAGPDGEEFCWWQCTVQGGRQGRDIDAITLARGSEALGAGEIMLNCIDRDGTNSVPQPPNRPQLLKSRG